MMNQLLLAQVLATGFDWNYLWHWTHDSDAWKAVIPASATVIASLIAITGVWVTARRATQQMELSKQGTPPELTRYKTWVEVSEKYKNLMEFERANSFKESENEYQEIRASRKVALERAVWERRVLSSCSDIVAQKRLLELSEGHIFGGEGKVTQSMPPFESKFIIFRLIASIIVFIFSCIFIVFLAKGIKILFDLIVDPDVDCFYVLIYAVLEFLALCISAMAVRFLDVVLDASYAGIRATKIAEYEYIKMVYKYEGVNAGKNLVGEVSKLSKNISRMKYALLDYEYSKVINLPRAWRSERWYSNFFKFLSFMLPYSALEKLNKGEKPYGSYLDGVFEIDAKNFEDKEPSTQDKAASDKKGKN